MRAQVGGSMVAVLVGACSGKVQGAGSEPVIAMAGATGAAGGPSGDRGGSAGDDASSGGTSAGAMSSGGMSSGGSGPDGGARPSCGDRKQEGGEACDDGNSVSGDGCSARCSLEPGWACVTGTCGWICGDHLTSGPMQCVAPSCDHASTPPDPPPADAVPGPCDLYALDGGPCVAAHSTVRALYATYAGPLYQVKLADGSTQDIPPTEPGGFADAALQDRFCAAGACTISILYDQSGQGNHLTHAPPGGAKPSPGNEAKAAALSATFGGHRVYGLKIAPGVAYRNNAACGTATGDDPETEYMVVAGDIYNAGCCFDYGNVERSSQNDGEGAVEAVYFGENTIWGKGEGLGPWVMGDLEDGLWPGNESPNQDNRSLNFKYVTAMLKGDRAGKNHWAIKAGDAQAGELRSVFDGPRPSTRYNPMRKQGAIGLGAAGDNSNASIGNFFEGVMTAHFSSNDADDAVQANLVSVYGPH